MTSDPYSGFSKHCTIYYTHHTDTFLISSSSRLSISFILYNVDIWDSSFANCKIIGNSLLSCHCCIDCVLHLVKGFLGTVQICLSWNFLNAKIYVSELARQNDNPPYSSVYSTPSWCRSLSDLGRGCHLSTCYDQNVYI